jgi:DNA-directed RNA polymerase specialized sigma24 family protein
MEEALAGLDETCMRALHMRLQKCTEEEIAANLGCTRSFVRNKLKRIRDRLQKLSGGDVGE